MLRRLAHPALRAAALTALAALPVLLVVDPPALSGIRPLLALALGATVLVLGMAWASVRLGRPDRMSEPEFERLVRRSEELAAEPSLRLAATRFELMVAEAIDRLPEEFQRLLDLTPVVVSRRGHEARAYGHYFGDGVAGDRYEDRIVLYEDTLERDFGHDEALLVAQVERVLLHELAHHLGWDEPGVRGLGL